MENFYRIPASISEDIKRYKQQVAEFINGGIHPTRFRGIRVPMGVYEQRQDDTYMMRIRIPAGGVTPHQMRIIAGLGKKYGSGTLHITTRQDIQIHKISLKDTPDVMEALYKAGLTTKGGGGNTVRNITSCSFSGVCEKEIFDVYPYAIALTEHMISDPRSYTLPRKFKVSFSGCSSDCALATINDVGFIAKEKDVEGKKVRGFSVYVAGGMGAVSKTAHKLEDFVPAEEVADICDAVKNLFDKNGNRRNKHQARLRFLWEKIGREKFVSLYREELEEIRKKGGNLLKPKGQKETMCDKVISTEEHGIEDEAFSAWYKCNVIPQRQRRFFCVKICTPLGETLSEQLDALSRVIERFGETSVRTTHDQNLLLKWVTKGELYMLFKELNNIGAADPVPPLYDMVCCAGASTCRLGICLSRGLSKAISSSIGKSNHSLTISNKVRIFISGCPNACGQHPVGEIGLFGAARRIGERIAPFYSIMLGGRIEEGKTSLGENIGIASARYIPDILKDFFNRYEKEGRGYEDFYSYLDAVGKAHMGSLISSYSSYMPSFGESPDFYTDWGADEIFSLKGRGAGECGAGIFDMIEVDLKDAEDAFKKASADLPLQPKESASTLIEAVVKSCRALLVTRGKEASSDEDAIKLFEKDFIDSGLISGRFRKTIFLAEEYGKKRLEASSVIECKDTIKDLVFSVKRLYDEMDDSLQFKKLSGGDKLEPSGRRDTDKVELFDLRGVSCPFNYVKAKLKLEMMAEGDTIEIFLDDGEPIQNVPGSLKNDGQEVAEIEKTEDGFYRMLVTKRV